MPLPSGELPPEVKDAVSEAERHERHKSEPGPVNGHSRDTNGKAHGRDPGLYRLVIASLTAIAVASVIGEIVCLINNPERPPPGLVTVAAACVVGITGLLSYPPPRK